METPEVPPRTIAKIKINVGKIRGHRYWDHEKYDHFSSDYYRSILCLYRKKSGGIPQPN